MSYQEIQLYSNKSKSAPTVKSWVGEEWAGNFQGTPEYRVLTQIATTPGIDKVAIMPDAHISSGNTMVGLVATSSDSIFPELIGGDIGCGVIAVKTDLKESELSISQRKSIITSLWDQNIVNNTTDAIYRPQDEIINWSGWKEADDMQYDLKSIKGDILPQMGSLGKGNHFMEICIDTNNPDGGLWFMLHSGSRNAGKKVAEEADRFANEFSKLSKDKKSDYEFVRFMKGTDEFKNYWKAMEWAQRYAFLNRSVLMKMFMQTVGDQILGKTIKVTSEINCHHNYIEQQMVGDKEVFVARKGAIKVANDVYGIIPGSSGDKSYIVTGKENVDSYFSAPHGAGREWSRKDAKTAVAENAVSQEELEASMKGVTFNTEMDVSEAPFAYKSIDKVIKQSEDLVTIHATLKQILNFKG